MPVVTSCPDCAETSNADGCPKHASVQITYLSRGNIEPFQRQPYLCPVCQGRGWVPPGFYDWMPYSSGGNIETCRTCKGEGALWGK